MTTFSVIGILFILPFLGVIRAKTIVMFYPLCFKIARAAKPAAHMFEVRCLTIYATRMLFCPRIYEFSFCCMKFCVFNMRYYFKIFNGIISSVSIFMVYMFCFCKQASNVFFHHIPMFKFPYIRLGDFYFNVIYIFIGDQTLASYRTCFDYARFFKTFVTSDFCRIRKNYDTRANTAPIWVMPSCSIFSSSSANRLPTQLAGLACKFFHKMEYTSAI